MTDKKSQNEDQLEDHEGKPKKAAPAKKANKVEAKDQPAPAKAAAASSDKGKGAKKASPGPKRNPLANKTFFAKTGEVPVKWRLIDAKGQTLGRLSSHIATILMGKDKPGYTRSTDTGDHVIVINAKEIVLTGKKWSDKVYQYHTNYPGGLKTMTARELRENHPDRLVQWSVYGMLPKGHMGRHWYKKLRVFGGAEHPHTAQQPKAEPALAERA